MTKQRATLSALAGGPLLAGALSFFGPTTQARACDCVHDNTSQHYAESETVFTGQPLFSFEVGPNRYYLTFVEKTYKGCEPDRQMLWVQTEHSPSSCGYEFELGQRYLIHAARTRSRHGSLLTTGDCAGNRRVDRLSEQDLAFLNSRLVCCGEDCTCVNGQQPTNCWSDLCDLQSACSDATTCEPNYCGDCNPEYFNEDGRLVCQDAQAQNCSTDADCAPSQYCGFDGQCAQDTTCNYHGECALPGNAYDVFVDCEGHGFCDAGTCSFTCGDAGCVDHQGYDFGICDFPLDWLMVDGACVNVPSGCESLLRNGGPGFASKRACEEACVFANSSLFGCGDDLSCDSETSYCLITTPGVEPLPGEPREYYDCAPLPEQCAAKPNPTCTDCFPVDVGADFGAAGSCQEVELGGLRVSLGLP